MEKEKLNLLYVVVGVVLIVILFFGITPVNIHYGEMVMGDVDMQHLSMDEKRESFISLKNDVIGDLMPQSKYRCCLEKPCTYCIEKTPGHGAGATCDCLGDLVNGVHPCGECIGEILEGHGNPYLKEYFAPAIAEKTGELVAIQRIIDEKYPEDV
jgi:hypothetical protein